MSLKTPLGKVLGFGTARDGTDHWWAQRVSAVALALLGTWFLALLAGAAGLGHAEVLQLVADPWNAVLLTLLCITVAYHSSLGLQVVIEDYVHSPGLKLATLLASRFAHVLAAVASVYAILRIGIAA